jgi:WD40 repeat protein
MRANTVDWIQHGNMPINSVDVQPRGYRILTGGSDNKVCIWNLLPIISKKYELLGCDSSFEQNSSNMG